MKNILEYLKSFLDTNTEPQKKEERFKISDLVLGEIICDESFNFYIVLKIDGDKIIGIKAYDIYERDNIDDFFKFNIGTDNLYFKLTNIKVLKDFEIKQTLKIMNNLEKQNLLKQLKLKGKTFYIDDGRTMNLNLPIQDGDIINCDMDYLVLDIKYDDYLCVPISGSIDELIQNVKENNFSNLDYSNIEYFLSRDVSDYAGTLSPDVFDFIKDEYNEYIENCNGKKFHK